LTSAAFLGVVAACGAALFASPLLAGLERPTTSPPLVAGAPAPAASAADRSARGHIDEAERLARSGQLDRAGQVLAKAAAISIADPSLNIRLIVLKHDIEDARTARRPR
jgi:hypothetical protein